MVDGLLSVECRPLRIDKLQDCNGNDLDLCYTVEDVFSDKASDNLNSIVRVIQGSEIRESSLPPESGLRPHPFAIGARGRKRRLALEDPHEVSHKSHASVRRHGKSNLSEPGSTKRPRMDDFLVLDSMDEGNIAGDTNVRNWDDRNGPAQGDSSAEEEEGGEEKRGKGKGEEEEDDNESFKDALMGEAPAHVGLSPSLGHHTHTPEAEPTLPASSLDERSPSVRVTRSTILPLDLQPGLSDVKEEVTSSPFLRMLPSKPNGLFSTKVSTIPGQNHHPSSSLSWRSPIQSRSDVAHGSSASKHDLYGYSNSITMQARRADSPRKRRSKSKSSVISETPSSEADDESSQAQAARKLQKEQEEQERETLIREAETQKQAEKQKRESEAQASEAEAQAKREQHEACEREARERTERLEKERLGPEQEEAASAKSAMEKLDQEKTVQAELSPHKGSQEKTPSDEPVAMSDLEKTMHEKKLAQRRERNASLKAGREIKAKELREKREQAKLVLKEAEQNVSLALTQQVERERIILENPELPVVAPVEDSQMESTAEKTGPKKQIPPITMTELKNEREVKAKQKELEKKQKQERQREEKRKTQQEKDRKANERKQVLDKEKQTQKDQELIKACEANEQEAQEKGSQGEAPQGSLNENGNIHPPALNSALKRKNLKSSAKKPTRVSFVEENLNSNIPPPSPTPPPTWVMKRTPILPPGYTPKPDANPKSKSSTAPNPTTSILPLATNGAAQTSLKSKISTGRKSKALITTHETEAKAPLAVRKSPRIKATPAEKPELKKPELKKPEPKKPESKKPVQSNLQFECESGSETEADTNSELESVDSTAEATLATPTPGSKAAKTIPRNMEVTDAPSTAQTPKKKPPQSPLVVKPKASKVKAKTAVTRYEESTESSSSDEVEAPPPPSSSLPPTSAQRPKPAPRSDSGSDSESNTEPESGGDEGQTPPVTDTPATRTPTTARLTNSTHQSRTNSSQRYKSLTDMELGPIPDVRDAHQAARTAAMMASGKRRPNGLNSSQAQKRREPEASDDSEKTDDDSSDYSEEEEPKAKKDALAGKRATVPKTSGFRFHLD